MPELLTIPISHYCEKARWALDRAGIEFREVRHVQMFHWPFAWAWARTPLVPIYRDGPRTIADSTAILQAIDETLPEERRLYPSDSSLRAEIDALEEDFDEGLGVETRRWMYREAFREPDSDLSFMAAGAPKIEELALPFARPFASLVIRHYLKVNDERVERGLKIIDDTLDRIDARLADGRRYLVGDRFTAADLSFACMLAPFLLPPEYGSPLPTVADLPPSYGETLARYRDRPSFPFGERMFREERRTEAAAADS